MPLRTHRFLLVYMTITYIIALLNNKQFSLLFINNSIPDNNADPDFYTILS